MKYLFFDIECANQFHGTGKICEYGYVITDEEFNILEKDLFIINPASGFDWYVLKKMLTFRKAEYEHGKKFPAFYDKIRSITCGDDVLVVGHTVDADAKYLNDDCARYRLPYLNYSFYDAKYMYSDYAEISEGVGLVTIGEKLGSEVPDHEHRSVDDAEATMYAVRAMCQKTGLSLSALIEKSENCRGETRDGVITTVVRTKARLRKEERLMKQNYMGSKSYLRFTRVAKKTEPDRRATGEMAGKRVCLSSNYLMFHCGESFQLVRAIAAGGAKCVIDPHDCDVFATYELVRDGKPRVCGKHTAALELAEAGKNIEFITVAELLSRLGTNDEKLASQAKEFRARRAAARASREKQSAGNQPVEKQTSKQTSGNQPTDKQSSVNQPVEK